MQPTLCHIYGKTAVVLNKNRAGDASAFVLQPSAISQALNKAHRPADASAVVRGALEPLVRAGVIAHSPGSATFEINPEGDGMGKALEFLQSLIERLQ